MQPNVGFDVELIAVATALATMGDLPLAEVYFKKAIEKSPSAYYKVVNLSMYAGFLFQQSRYAEGRGIYRDSLACLDDSTDFNRWANGTTYQAWFIDEVWNRDGASDEANKYYDNARRLFQSLSVAATREGALHDLELARGSPDGPPPPARPGS
jgi:tetratricopeptide (TPR) repeat protein